MKIPPQVFKVHKILQGFLEPQSHYLVALSGGADSLALAHSCMCLAKAGWGTFTYCHVNHGLRGAEAEADEAFVKSFCQDRGLQLVVEQVQVLDLAKREGLSLEEAARGLRYEALYKQADLVKAKAVLTGHHSDDQAETVLFKLLRGAGLQGLGAMAPVQDKLLRPFLGLSRRDLEDYCQALSLQFCVDTTNQDTYYTRNRIRLELLPALEKAYNPEIKQALCRTAAQLREAQECLDLWVNKAYSDLVKEEQDSFIIAAKGLRTLPAAISKGLLRRAYFRLGGKELSFERTEALMSFCSQGRGGSILQLPGKITALYRKQQLKLQKEKEL